MTALLNMTPTTLVQPSFLTATAQRGLVNALERFHNALSVPHRKALFTLVEAMTNMATGQLTGRYAFGLPTGTGKTRAIIEWSAAVSNLKLPYSMVVSASRIEALCTMKRDMVENGIPESQIGLVYSPVYETTGKGRELKYSEPFTTDNDSRPFLLCSHQLIRSRESNLAQYNTFNGEPRSLCIYDESLLVSDIEHFLVKDLCTSLAKWKANFKFDEGVNRTTILNWLNEQEAMVTYVYDNFKAGEYNEVPPPSFQLSLSDAKSYEHYFRTQNDSLLADFLAISGLPLRMLKHGKSAVVSYRIVIPDALKNMLVLDASYPIRRLEKSDITLINAETLPTCKAFNVQFDKLKRFDNVTLFRMAHRGSRTSAVNSKSMMKKLMQDVVKVVQGIPAAEHVLIYVYKEKFNRNPKRALEIELEKADLYDPEDKTPSKLHLETWGNETSLNSYSHVKHVMLVGILHRDLSELEAQFLGQLNDLTRKLAGEDLQSIALSERAHCAYQAFSRGSCRVMQAGGQANSMTGYVIEFDEGLEHELEKVMPGATWKTWEPVYADTLAHGRLVLDLANRVQACLKPFPIGSKVSCKKVKALCQRLPGASQVNVVDRKTFQRALDSALDHNPQWKRIDQSLCHGDIPI